MSRKCFFCARGSKKAGSRSHSNIRTLRRQYVNLQRKWINGGSVLVCTSCIKTMKSKKVSTLVPASCK